MKAQVVTETLTDGSIVFNVVHNGQEVACPPTQSEAESIAEKINTEQWQAAYQSEWDRLFAALDAETQELVKVSPSGSASVDLAYHASCVAEKVLAAPLG